MLKGGILHPQLKRALALAGHRKYVAVVDSGFGIPDGVERVDLAVMPNIPTNIQVLEGVLAEFCVERAIITTEIHERAPEALAELEKRLAGIPIEFVPGPRFHEEMKKAMVVIQTGDFGTHCGNVILVSGCAY